MGAECAPMPCRAKGFYLYLWMKTLTINSFNHMITANTTSLGFWMWKYQFCGLDFNFNVILTFMTSIWRNLNFLKYFAMKTLEIVSFNYMIRVNTTFCRFLDVQISIFRVKFEFSVILTIMTSLWRNFNVF